MDKILVVEDRRSLLKILKEVLEGKDYEVVGVVSGTQALDRLSHERFDLVLSDLKLPGPDGLAILDEVKRVDPDLPVVIMTAFGTVETAVQAMKNGAEEFLLKPVDHDYLLLLVQRIIEKQRLVRENILLKESYAAQFGFPMIIGASPTMENLSRQVQKVASTEVSVLLLGESGTGKELFARAVHSISPRRDKPFVAINCAAIPDTLIENELFGHEKGAYTGATNRQMGKFELAHTGTIFLDEIGELGLNVQSKILRVLQERSFERVGGLQTINVDVRIIAASNRDLKQAVSEHLFREDLFYRLSVFPVTIPPLRDRTGDIPLLAKYFLSLYGARMGKPGLELEDAAIAKLMAHTWPGNVRELQNTLERAVILANGPLITTGDLQINPDERRSATLLDLIGHEGSLAEVTARCTARLEEEMVVRALERAGGDEAGAAKMLKIPVKKFKEILHRRTVET